MTQRSYMLGKPAHARLYHWIGYLPAVMRSRSYTLATACGRDVKMETYAESDKLDESVCRKCRRNAEQSA